MICLAKARKIAPPFLTWERPTPRDSFRATKAQKAAHGQLIHSRRGRIRSPKPSAGPYPAVV
eukprot:4235981-Pyramimonas_sp.AAC.1